MQTVETLRSRSQTGITSLVDNAEEQPSSIKKWGVTAGSAVVGAVALKAAAGGIIALTALLMAPPVAMTLGAVGGGLLGWNYMRNRQTTPPLSVSPMYMSTPDLLRTKGSEGPMSNVTVVERPTEFIPSSSAENLTGNAFVSSGNL